MQREMKQWIPLFKIFLNSPSPAFDASLYFQQQHNPSTSSFLLLLSTPTCQNSLIFIQTLPLFIQSRILSFLTIESECFCHHRLHSLAIRILKSNNLGFWVRNAACNLLAAVSSEPATLKPTQDEDEFHALPDWLPMPPTQLPRTLDLCSSSVFPDEPESEAIVIEQEEVDSCSPVAAAPLDPQDCDRAIALKDQILAAVTTSEAIAIARDIEKLLLDSGPNNEPALLGLIEPWEGDDEILSVILSNLTCSSPAHVLCSISLPKLLILSTPASRVLLSATISFCKLHPVAAVEALVFSLALRKEGINMVLCDALARVIKECLHRSHVSAFCQKLLCGEGNDRKFVCLPRHQNLISHELAWNEPMFALFQHILIQDVYLTPDSVDQIVSVIVGKVDVFAASLKFGNFFLCFVTKCAQAVKVYEAMLKRAAERTNTFVTKSILLKLDSL